MEVQGEYSSRLLKQFILIVEEGGIDKKVDKINQFLSLLLEEINPDQYISFSRPSNSSDCPPSEERCQQTLLHILSCRDEINYELLFQDGNKRVDCNLKDSDGLTPLHHACYYCNGKAIRLLLKHGANVNLLDKEERTPLMTLFSGAVRDDDIWILDLLLEHGANPCVEFTNSGAKTNLLLFALESYYNMPHFFIYPNIDERGDHTFLKRLLQLDAGIDYRNENGENALHIACSENDINAIQILVQYGCDYGLKDKTGQLPIERITDPHTRTEFLLLVKTVGCR